MATFLTTRREYLVFNTWKVVDLPEVSIVEMMGKRILGAGTLDVIWLKQNEQPLEVMIWKYRDLDIYKGLFGKLHEYRRGKGQYVHFLGKSILLPCEFDNSLIAREWHNEKLNGFDQLEGVGVSRCGVLPEGDRC